MRGAMQVESRSDERTRCASASSHPLPSATTSNSLELPVGLEAGRGGRGLAPAPVQIEAGGQARYHLFLQPPQSSGRVVQGSRSRAGRNQLPTLQCIDALGCDVDRIPHLVDAAQDDRPGAQVVRQKRDDIGPFLSGGEHRAARTTKTGRGVPTHGALHLGREHRVTVAQAGCRVGLQ
jgi:hypothetical protein